MNVCKGPSSLILFWMVFFHCHFGLCWKWHFSFPLTVGRKFAVMSPAIVAIYFHTITQTRLSHCFLAPKIQPDTRFSKKFLKEMSLIKKITPPKAKKGNVENDCESGSPLNTRLKSTILPKNDCGTHHHMNLRKR